MNKPEETWTEYRRLVLAELERLHDEIETLKKEAKARDIRQATLGARLTVYATIAALIGGGIISYLLEFIK